MNDTIISLNGITKEFRIPRRKEATVLSHMTSRIVGREIQRPHTVTALHDVSLNVQAREVVGIVGDNAAGKSTLLRVIAGIVHPTSGHVTVRGNVTSLISMSVSLRKTLTVKDNIFLAASCFGMTRAQTVRCFQDILEFGGLTDYVDMFPYQLSDGMNQRLAFSIAIHANPDILLLDEVFSAGDIGFTKKASARMEEIIRGKCTVVVVSHNMERLRNLCDRVVWLEHGHVREIGEPNATINHYINAHTAP